MWDLPRSGLEPESPALAGGFKANHLDLFSMFCYFSMLVMSSSQAPSFHSPSLLEEKSSDFNKKASLESGSHASPESLAGAEGADQSRPSWGTKADLERGQ